MNDFSAARTLQNDTAGIGEADALDAYSRVVVSAVEGAGPAVVSLLRTLQVLPHVPGGP